MLAQSEEARPWGTSPGATDRETIGAEAADTGAGSSTNPATAQAARAVTRRTAREIGRKDAVQRARRRSSRAEAETEGMAMEAEGEKNGQNQTGGVKRPTNRVNHPTAGHSQFRHRIR